MALTSEQWALEALAAIGRGGVIAVAVEPLAARLGATKGSFYWHFRSRDELLCAALGLWEQRETVDVIEGMKAITDPVERMSRLFRAAFSDEQGGAVDVALLAEADNPLVRPVLQRVTTMRVNFLRDTFTAMGFTPRGARHRALLAYSAYVGYFQLRRGAPDQAPAGAERAAYLKHVTKMLAAE